jgi:hypothetical protein
MLNLHTSPVGDSVGLRVRVLRWDRSLRTYYPLNTHVSSRSGGLLGYGGPLPRWLSPSCHTPCLLGFHRYCLVFGFFCVDLLPNPLLRSTPALFFRRDAALGLPPGLQTSECLAEPGSRMQIGPGVRGGDTFLVGGACSGMPMSHFFPFFLHWRG